MRNPLLLFVFTLLPVAVTVAQDKPSLVSLQQLDQAVDSVARDLDRDPTERDALMGYYRDTRAALQDKATQETRLRDYEAAHQRAAEEARQIQAETTAKASEPEPDYRQDLKKLSLPEIEQLVQSDKAELAALQQQLEDTENELDRQAERPARIRERLTEVTSLLVDLNENLALLPDAPAPGSEAEARRWLAEARLAATRAEKAALDAELLSQPMRVSLLQAQRDQLSQRVRALKARLAARESYASELRQGVAEEAQAAAATAEKEARDKHPLVQRLARDNARLSKTLSERNQIQRELRIQEEQIRARAEQLEADLKAIERRLDIMGMTRAVGDILREQTTHLPNRKQIARELARVEEMVTNSSLRQLELEDERRQLRDMDDYVERRMGSKADADPDLATELRALAQQRRELVAQAIDLETNYASDLADLNQVQHRLAEAVARYSDFIAERLLWVQSGPPLSAAFFKGLPEQLTTLLDPREWRAPLTAIATGPMHHPLMLLGLTLVALLAALTPQLRTELEASGIGVGIARDDHLSVTFRALALSLLLALKWPLLLLVLALPLAELDGENAMASGLYQALIVCALYFLCLQALRWMLVPKGLVQRHYRWPPQQVRPLLRRVQKFEVEFLLPLFLTLLCMGRFPETVGGPLGSLALLGALLSLTHLFFRMPHFFQDRMEMLFVDVRPRQNALVATVVRFLLTWVPVAMLIAVLFGYTYTVLELARLLVNTVLLFVGLLVLHELGLRWLRLTRRRMRLASQQEQGTSSEQEEQIEEELLEQDREVLDETGTRFLNALMLLGGLIGIAIVWAEVLPALGILDAVELWHHKAMVEGSEVSVPTTLADVARAVAIVVVAWIAIKHLPSLIEILLRQKVDVSPASAFAAAAVLRYILITLALISVLGIIGGSWSQIQWAVAALGVGIGFGLQEIVANFICGLIILFEQPIRVGDTVTVGETTGTVTRIRMRATTIVDWDRRELLVPNKEFITSRLLNWSLSDQVTRLNMRVGVAYGTDMAKAMHMVQQVVQSHPLVLEEPPPLITFDEFSDNSLTIGLRCFIDHLDQRLTVASAIRLEISHRFEEAGISVSFPQRDVHLDTTSPLEITLVEAPGKN